MEEKEKNERFIEEAINQEPASCNQSDNYKDAALTVDAGQIMEAAETEEFGDKETTNRKGVGLPAVTALVVTSALISAIATAFSLPYVYGSSPQDVYGEHKQIQNVISAASPVGVSNGTTKIITVKNTSTNQIAAVAQKLQSSVVNISATQPLNTMFRQHYNSSFKSDIGSGVIFSSDGYILTNNHVVVGMTDIYVTIGNEEIKAKLVAADPETDLAVIKVNKTGLQPAEFGSTKELQVGDLAVAIGSPFGLEHTVTSGIISALNRTVSVPDDKSSAEVTYINLIQTDASINPGNSGGALSDANGRVIGINALIMSSSGASEGVGFAIPSEIAQSVARQLIGGGKASHAYIGITGHDVSDIFSGKNASGATYGAEIVDVVAGGPAAKAGMKQQDIIVAVDDSQVNNMNELIAAIRQKQVGDTVKIAYMRGKEKNVTDLTLAEKPNQSK